MTRRTIQGLALSAAAAGALLTQPVGVDRAEEPTVKTAIRTDLKTEILFSMDEQTTEERSWLSPHLSLNLKSGLAYKRKVTVSDRPLDLRLYGPVMRKQKALGLRFKIRF